MPYWKFLASYISLIERAEGFGGALDTSGERESALSILHDILARREGVKDSAEEMEEISCITAGISAKGTKLGEVEFEVDGGGAEQLAAGGVWSEGEGGKAE